MAPYDLEGIESWLSKDRMEVSRLGPMFVELVRFLTEAEEPEDWSKSIRLTRRFLILAAHDLEREYKWPDADSSRLFSAIVTVLAEAGQYRHETYAADDGRRDVIRGSLLPQMAEIRGEAIEVAKRYLQQPVFDSLKADIEFEAFPLLESMGDTSGQHSVRALDRYMPFRVIQLGNLAECLYGMQIRTNDPRLVGCGDQPGLLQQLYDRKYIRFGTSGFRGRWGVDFTEPRAKRVVQAVCDFLSSYQVPDYAGAEDLRGKRLVIGYDSRCNARRVAEWAAQVCIGNGFKVDLCYRDAPTPALVYYLTDYLDPGDVAGLIICTASHNPPEWQGIKFNPRLGYSAPTNTTDFIAARVNRLQILDRTAAESDLDRAERRGRLRGFDPIVDYSHWLLESGHGNGRISIDTRKIREYFSGKTVIADEMYGASRGYLPRILGEIGVRHRVIHAERNPNLPGLAYANPEEPFINDLKEAVSEGDDAALGLGMDTDADRFGVVDADGIYYRPNQILPMLVRYLGIDRGLKGRVVATQTGSPLLEKLAGMIPENEESYPEPGVVPAYVGHPFYHRRVGEREDRAFKYTFMVPVGIKYIEEQRRTNRRYQFLKELPDNWRDVLLIGGEESSGLTTRGHVTDKDGVWANLLIMDMVAHYGKSVAEIWEATVAAAGWRSYGGYEDIGSNTGRRDVDAVLEAKEAFINSFLDRFEGVDAGQAEFAGLQVVYSGGIRYDYVELQLQDAGGGREHHLRVRASGTEPINRIYVESSDRDVAKALMEGALSQLDELSAAEIARANSEWRLVKVLSSTGVTPLVSEAVADVVDSREDWTLSSVVSKLEQLLPRVENRVRKLVYGWIDVLRGA